MLRQPRLHQPLFDRSVKTTNLEHGVRDASLYNAALGMPELRFLRLMIMAYDSIWSQLYRPNDITEENIEKNAIANLKNLEQEIMQIVGPDAFETDPRQLSLFALNDANEQ